MSTSSLNREQKEAIGLLGIGTFLEYFDLMLYVHMAVLLNELFFPKTDPHTAALFSALAFCSTYILRPFGALIFGYIGDTIGRKPTVVITTMMMSISCVVMANLPTYAQIGVTAAWVVTICRIVQGLSSMGEAMGAVIYITEITKPPVQYPAVGLISVASILGTVVSLAVASLVTTSGLNWRIAFWIGAGIAVIGSIARTCLRETPEFVDMKRRMKREIEDANLAEGERAYEIRKMNRLIRSNGKKEKLNKETLLAFFMIYCGWPVSFYLAYMYFNPLLKTTYGYSSEDIIFHNFCLSIICVISSIVWCLLSHTIFPLRILKWRGIGFLVYAFCLPMMIAHCTMPLHIFALQSVIFVFSTSAMPGEAIFVKRFPTLKRFMTASVEYAASRAVIYVFTSFGLVYLTEWFGHYGLLIIMIPVTIGFLWGVHHFIKLEKESGEYFKQSSKKDIIYLPYTATPL